MTTKIKKLPTVRQQPATSGKVRMINWEAMPIPVNCISFNPKNHRKLYSESALLDFSSGIARLGIISPITVRPQGKGKYELVVGERRLRGAILAKLQKVPCVIKDYTDSEVNEIALLENLQREDPHPLHIAQAIGIMRDEGKCIEEIATRLGKSAKFVYARLKLLNLCDAFQEMFIHNVIGIGEAFEIASISSDSQLAFYEDHCKEWKEQKHFSVGNLQYRLAQYRFDLTRAPFDIKDKKLLPTAGACTGCPHNTACLKTLFPELAKEKKCTNQACFMAKCQTNFRNSFTSGVTQYQPVAFIMRDHSPLIDEVLSPYADIDRLDYKQIRVVERPEHPEKDMYMIEGKAGRYVLDKPGFAQAVDEYNNCNNEFDSGVEDGTIKAGLIIAEHTVIRCYFSIRGNDQSAPSLFGKVTAAEVQAAIKTKTATPELLQLEIQRLNDREKRSKELDSRKVQETIFNTFQSRIVENPTANKWTSTDSVAARLIVYRSLNYENRQLFDETLHAIRPEIEDDAALFEVLSSLSEDQYSYMIRLSLACQSESKVPGNACSFFFQKVAEAAGVDVDAIAAKHKSDAEEREDKIIIRKKGLERMITRLKNAV